MKFVSTLFFVNLFLCGLSVDAYTATYGGYGYEDDYASTSTSFVTQYVTLTVCFPVLLPLILYSRVIRDFDIYW